MFCHIHTMQHYTAFEKGKKCPMYWHKQLSQGYLVSQTVCIYYMCACTSVQCSGCKSFLFPSCSSASWQQSNSSPMVQRACSRSLMALKGRQLQQLGWASSLSPLCHSQSPHMRVFTISISLVFFKKIKIPRLQLGI